MRADVTVGAFLSGGVDSTAIAVLAKEHNPDLVTFTTGFEREGFSEVDVASETASAIGVKHVIRTVSAGRDDGRPAARSSGTSTTRWPTPRSCRCGSSHGRRATTSRSCCRARAPTSCSADTRSTTSRFSLAPFEKVPGFLRRLLGRASTRLPEGMRGKDLLRRGAIPLEQRYYGNARIFRDDQLAGVLRRYDPRRSHTDVTEAHYAVSRDWDPVARMQHVDLFTWLRGDILVKADKMTMANSLELRVPFLDPEVFEIARHLPRSEKVSNGTTKYALRRAMEGIVPGHVINRRKLGFPVPIRHWLRDEMYDWARDIIRDSQADHLVDLGAVQRLLDAHRTGPVDHSRRVWTLLVFLLWHGIFVEDRIHPVIPEPVFPVRL